MSSASSTAKNQSPPVSSPKFKVPTNSPRGDTEGLDTQTLLQLHTEAEFGQAPTQTQSDSAFINSRFAAATAFSGAEPGLENAEEMIRREDIANAFRTIREVINKDLSENLTDEEKAKGFVDPFGDNVIGLVTYLRTYSRKMKDGSNEGWEDTVERMVRACNDQLGCDFTEDEQNYIRHLFSSIKCLPAGRFIWQLGTGTVDRQGLVSLNNCASIVLRDDPARCYGWIMDLLMLGAGVGFNIFPEDIATFPPVQAVDVTRDDVSDADFIVPDSREGWVELLMRSLTAHFVTGESFTYSCQLVRSHGAPIKTFGGVASGPDILEKGITEIGKLLNGIAPKNLTPTNAMDIANIIGWVVKAGNVRRCLPAGTLVHLKRGMTPIEDVKRNDVVLTSDGYKKVVKTFTQGIQRLVTVVTEDSHFECTAKHSVRVYDPVQEKLAWKQARELVENDILISSRVSIDGDDQNLPGTNVNLSTRAAWMFGYVTSRGITTGSNLSVKIDRTNPSFFSNILGGMQEISPRMEYSTEKTRDFIILTTRDGKLFKFLNEYILQEKHDADSRRVPGFILSATTPIRLHYVYGIFQGMGKITEWGTVNIIETLTRPRLARDIQLLLFGCGLESRSRLSDEKFCIDLVSEHSIAVFHKIPALNFHNGPEVSNNSFTYSKVMGVQDIAKSAYTYDLEVKDNHEFFANGYLVHNSAQIAIGDAKDVEFIKAKNWASGDIPHYRANSNNTVRCNDIKDLPEVFWDGYQGNGEPYGLFNQRLCRQVGRTGDTRYPDPQITGLNPCAEQPLIGYNPDSKNVGGEMCCLAEIFLPRIESKRELQQCARLLYRVCKHALALKCHQKGTEELIHKNMRMGISVTGYLQSSEEQKSWLAETYEMLRMYDEKYSERKNLNKSIKLTTCKPSGCVAPESNILTSEGLLRMDQLGDTEGSKWQNLGTEITAKNVSGVPHKIALFHNNGEQSCVQITTNDGAVITCTPNHRVRVADTPNSHRWVQANALRKSDLLVSRIGGMSNGTKARFAEVPNFTIPNINAKWYRIIGYIINSGVFVNSEELQFKAFTESNKNHVCNFLMKYMPGVTSQGTIVCVRNPGFANWVEENGILSKDDGVQDLPMVVRQASSAHVRAFLSSLLNITDFNNNSMRWKFPTAEMELVPAIIQPVLALGRAVNYYTSQKMNKVFIQSEIPNGIVMSPVQEIGYITSQTHDVSVENSNQYILNGVVVHNTLSLLGGVTPGIHPGYSRHYRRRIRFAADSPLIPILKKAGYHVECAINFDGSRDESTQIASFPESFPETTVIAADCTAIDQMEYVARLQREWCDNAVSCTVYYRKHELPAIREWLKKNYQEGIKSISFLLHFDSGFHQLPMEEVTKSEYEEMKSHITAIDHSSYTGKSTISKDDEKFIADNVCPGGACPLR